MLLTNIKENIINKELKFYLIFYIDNIISLKLRFYDIYNYRYKFVMDKIILYLFYYQWSNVWIANNLLINFR